MNLVSRGLLTVLLDPVLLLRAFYLAAAALIVTISTVPALRGRFLAYGSRSSCSSLPSQNASTACARALDHLTAYRVPHRYFIHFYILSVLSSFFWAFQIWTRGPVFQLLSASSSKGAPTMTLPQIYLAWTLMLLQGLRRLLECLVLDSRSTSTMWIGHYVLGHLFYLTMNISIWIEGVIALCSPSSSSRIQPALSLPMQIIVLPVLFSAHVGQHSYHAYLSSLRTAEKSYSLPSHWLFTNTLCPHYMLEILIYICLALVTAPDGRLINWTVATGTILVAVNLGVTARGTKDWYAEKFGKETVAEKWKLIPWVW